MSKKGYIPAFKYDWLTKAFDPFLRITMPEKRFKNLLLEQAGIKESETVLDFGCGTATLTIMAKGNSPAATIHGVDIDSKVLEIAKNKIANIGYEVLLNKFDGTILPYPDGYFDKIISSLVFHHLTREQKITALQEIYRVAKKGGGLHIIDFGKPHNIFMKVAFSIIRVFDGLENTHDNANGLLPALIQNVGFESVAETRRIMTIFGTLSLFYAYKP